MKKSNKIIALLSSLFMGLVLVRFALSKLFAETESVNQFIEMAEPIGIDPTLFRIFSGVTILIVAVFYLINVRYIGFKNKLPVHFEKSYVLGVFTMSGALFSEFLLRTNPKLPMVFLALLIVVFSILNFMFLRKSNNLKSFN